MNRIASNKALNREIASRFISLFELHAEESFCTIAHSGEVFTYGQFWKAIQDLYSRISSVTEAHERIALIYENSFELMCFYFVGLIKGLVLIPIDPLKGIPEILEILLEGNCNKVFVGVEIDLKVYSGKIYQVAALPADPKLELSVFNKVDFSAMFTITFTSGTTGKPKGVMHSFSNYYKASMAFGCQIGLGSTNIFYHNLPMTYMAGILNLIFMPFVMGSKVVIGPRFSVNQTFSYWGPIVSHHVNTFFFIPAIIGMLMKFDRGELGVAYCRRQSITALVGTAPLNHNLQEAFESRYGVRLFESYGLTETLFISTNSPLLKRSYGVGKILAGVELVLGDDKELAVTTDWNFHGYFGHEANGSGYFRTGDLAEVDTDNFLEIIGRKKDIIIRGGINISPRRILNVVDELNLGVDYIIIGLPDDILGEKVVLFYEGSESELDRRAINSLVKRRLGQQYGIDQFHGLVELPRNSNGKIDNCALRKLSL